MNVTPLRLDRPPANAPRVRALIRALALAREALRHELGSDVEAVLDPRSGFPMLLRSGQDALLQSATRNQQFSTILANVRDSVVVLDRDGVVTFWNAGAEALFGYTAAERLGRPLAELHPGMLADLLADELRDIWDGHERRTVHECRRKDGETVWIDVRSAPLRDLDGVVTGILRVANDVTAQKRVEAELRRASEEADDANRAKSEFLANMSHEIRTPMNAIIGMTDIVLDTELSAEQRRCLEVVRQSSDGLLDIINDILDFSKIEAGRLALDPAPFDLHEALDRSLRALAVRSEQKGLELIGDIAADVPPRVVGDAGRLSQVLINLVGNAIKFTEHGEVAVAVALATCDADSAQLHFRVRDTGIGIAADKHAAIFRAFEQADGSSTRRYGGTGLGLTISASLVALMGGRIWVESAPGRGSTFHFTVRVGRAPAADDDAPPVALAGVRTLLVEANRSLREAVASWLTRWGATCTAVESAAAARAALAAADESGFDLALLDGDLLGEDGWSLLAWLAASPRHAAMPRVLLGSQLDRDGLQRAAALGAVHVSKPLSQPALRAALATARSGEPLASGPPRLLPAAVTPTRPLRVLVAEDQDVNQELICHLLAKHGHSVALAHNGSEALAHWQRERFDLVLMDVQMPVMDGLQATARIRDAERERGEHVPIVALTAHAMCGDAARCLSAGMDAHVTKPLHIRDLLALLRRVAAGDTAELPAPAAAAAASPTAEPIDLPRCLAIVGGQSDLLGQLAATFLKNVGARLQALRDAIACDDADQAFNSAHSLKGSLANFAADLAVQVARRLEICALEADFAGARQALVEFEPELARVLNALAPLANVSHAA
ncbi:MAG: response regulator [Deltaproteobacteria bacterium]|nr:response regulator [Deltaproteobacteria bacterium]